VSIGHHLALNRVKGARKDDHAEFKGDVYHAHPPIVSATRERKKDGVQGHPWLESCFFGTSLKEEKRKPARTNGWDRKEDGFHFKVPRSTLAVGKREKRELASRKMEKKRREKDVWTSGRVQGRDNDLSYYRVCEGAAGSSIRGSNE